MQLPIRALPILESPDPAIACTLDLAEQGERVVEWSTLAASATAVETVEAGVRLRFKGPEVDVDGIADLVAREEACCAFLAFALATNDAWTTLDVTGPPSARPIIEALISAVR